MFIKNRLGLTESVEAMLAQSQRLNQVTNNLANVDSTGYKKDNLTFWETLYTASDNRQRVGKALHVINDHQQGTNEMTGNPLDLAINGKGFFKVQTPQGVRYTRAGNFQLNTQGQITTSNGHLLLGQGGPIVAEGTEIVIARDGSVIVDGENINQISLVNFTDTSNLEKEGVNLFRIKEENVQEEAPQNVTIQQGFLEGSNVNVVTEMAEMIDLQRAFESQQRVIRTIDDINDLAIRRVGKLTP